MGDSSDMLSGKGRVRILVIDDNLDMLSIYREMFKDEPRYEADLMSDAMQGLRSLEDGRYDMIILDIIMEPLSGESFFVYLRGNESTMKIPVVIVSVLEPASLEALKRLNHTTILQKPIRKEDLFGAIDKFISLYGHA
ncbi:MAG: response regulator [Proteobacteria bacterium]|nr:response regulator [Pseudomonadota bacterium]